MSLLFREVACQNCKGSSFTDLDIPCRACNNSGYIHSPLILPAIVCLCGSTRFWEAFRDEGLRLTLESKIVLSIGIAAPDVMTFAHDPEFSEKKKALDALHLKKIELADEVFVLNVGNYMGESTRREIAHARKLGKPVKFLEEEK